jgi:hypothetical protein
MVRVNHLPRSASVLEIKVVFYVELKEEPSISGIASSKKRIRMELMVNPLTFLLAILKDSPGNLWFL